MLIWLSFLVCFHAGIDCHVDVPNTQPFDSLTSCQMAGMQSAPSWEQEHPGWTVSKIRCSMGTRPHQENMI